jgi:hypothetical protein
MRAAGHERRLDAGLRQARAEVAADAATAHDRDTRS